ncbi:cytochrome P450 [Actinocorallia longicatena]|uniref:Cytochrome P450 n=1 Tax=Actinocorallia longicatena TaxID=111803 RepID=A0ABP6QLY7_9ACTN
MTVLAPENLSQEALRIFLRMIRPRPLADPYPMYRRLREIAPFHTIRLPGLAATYVAATHAEVSELLRRKEFGPLTPGHLDLLSPGWHGHRFTRVMYTSMAFKHGADHRTRRDLVFKDFTPRRTEGHRAAIERAADAILDRLGGEVDLEEALALPFTALTIGEALGMPGSVALELGRLARAAGTVFEPMASARQRAAEIEAGTGLVDGFAALLDERRRKPERDLLTFLVKHHGEDEEEALVQAVLLFGAGFDSPVSMVGLGSRLFIEHPDQAWLVREDPSLARSAAEEILRYESPVQLVVRAAYADTELAGTPVPDGGVVFGLLAAGNRDPLVCPDPERFDVARAPIQTLSFAAGAHYCLGAPLARLQAEILFPRLLRRFPDMRLTGEPRYRSPGSMLRGLEYLPVHLS